MTSMARHLDETVRMFINRYGKVKHVIVPPRARFAAREAFGTDKGLEVTWIVAHGGKGADNEHSARERLVFGQQGLPHIHCFDAWAIFGEANDLTVHSLEGDENE